MNGATAYEIVIGDCADTQEKVAQTLGAAHAKWALPCAAALAEVNYFMVMTKAYVISSGREFNRPCL